MLIKKKTNTALLTITIILTIFAVVLIMFACSGCLLTSMLGGAESPRPKEYQVEASKEIVNSNVPVVVGAQTNKQDNIQIVALEALKAIEKTTTAAQAEAITNVAANSFKAIEKANGTAEIVDRIMENSGENILTMSTLQYAAYAAGQTAVAMRNQEAVYQGIKVGWKWTTAGIASAAGGTTVFSGLVAFALSAYRRMRSKDKVLKSTGNVLEKFIASHPEPGDELKNNLAKAGSKLATDVSKEFGV